MFMPWYRKKPNQHAINLWLVTIRPIPSNHQTSTATPNIFPVKVGRLDPAFSPGPKWKHASCTARHWMIPCSHQDGCALLVIRIVHRFWNRMNIQCDTTLVMLMCNVVCKRTPSHHTCKILQVGFWKTPFLRQNRIDSRSPQKLDGLVLVECREPVRFA
jgi:hypothetical protein